MPGCLTVTDTKITLFVLTMGKWPFVQGKQELLHLPNTSSEQISKSNLNSEETLSWKHNPCSAFEWVSYRGIA